MEKRDWSGAGVRAEALEPQELFEIFLRWTALRQG